MDFAVSPVDPRTFLFEPTEDVYKRLASGDERDLREVASRISHHLKLSVVPAVRYDWGLKMEPEVAGQIKSAACLFRVQIPFFYVGKAHSLGGILAHELTHALLFSRGVSLEDSNENEPFTDLAAVFAGLGKLLLNGALDQGGGLGYLSPDLITYSFGRVCNTHGIDKETALKHLTGEASELMQHP